MTEDSAFKPQGGSPMTKITVAIVGALIGLILPIQLAFADGGATPGPLSELTAEWWQWAQSIPFDQNPQLDSSGQYCMVGQRGPIWFLAGVSGGGPATRTCSVPENKALFFPVINSFWNNTPSTNPDCGQSGENYDVKTLIYLIKTTGIDSAHDLSVTVDKKALDPKQIQHVLSVPFPTWFPADNVFGPVVCKGQPLPAGIYSPSMDDGYYVLLPPLKLGSHTLKFRGEYGSGTGSVLEDVTYDLTVVPVSLK
jgi:hypothetical protein